MIQSVPDWCSSSQELLIGWQQRLWSRVLPDCLQNVQAEVQPLFPRGKESLIGTMLSQEIFRTQELDMLRTKQAQTAWRTHIGGLSTQSIRSNMLVVRQE